MGLAPTLHGRGQADRAPYALSSRCPLFGIRIAFSLVIDAVFTVVSLVLSYALRRLFEALRS